MTSLSDQPGGSVTVGRYVLHRQIARGGMATIHIARLMGDEGFSRIVAAKRLLPDFAMDSEFVAMFLDEARIASRVQHPNVVPVLDVVTAMDEVLLVQEYVHGVPLHYLLNRARQSDQHVPVPVAVAIATQVLSGLHAAHELVDEMGSPLAVVHRDVSPQNVMVSVEGSARLLDFGVAKATMAAHVTREGTYKGKLAYSAPEQLRGTATRQSDIYSLGVMLWELLVGHRMHGPQGEAELVATIMHGELPQICETLAAEHEWSAIDESHWAVLAQLEPLVEKALSIDLDVRFKTATEMEEALLALVRPASASTISAWVKGLGKEYLEKQDKVLAAEEASWRRILPRTTTNRRTPVPGELRRLPSRGEQDSITTPSAASAKSLPSAPRRRGPQALIALLSVLVVALAIGIVLIVRNPSAQSSAAADPLTPATPALTPAPPPAPTPAPPKPAADVKPSITMSVDQVETKPVPPPPQPPPAPPPQPPPVRRAVTVQRAQPQPQRAAPPRKQPEKTTTVAPVETPRPEPGEGKGSASCTPPYYFEGTKKIFKPACI